MFPQVFGIEHWLYMAVFIALGASALVLAKKYAKTEFSRTVILKTLAAALLASVLANRLVKVFENGEFNAVALIPDSFCSMDSVLLSLAVLFGKKDNCIYHSIWLISLFGGVATVIYPAFISYNPSFFCVPTISGLLHHSFSAILVLMLLLFGQINVSYKKWYYSFLTLACYMTLGAFLMGHFGMPDAYHIKEPLISGTPLTAWVMAPMYAAGYAITLAVFELVRWQKSKNG